MQVDDNFFRVQRDDMLHRQLRARGIADSRLLEVIRSVPRHEFVPRDLRDAAYRDTPLPIGDDQTISQPYIVAYMTQLLHLSGRERVLEIGTGSGYQAAILSCLSRQVFTLERNRRLARTAGENLFRLGYHNIDVHVGDGSQGLPDMGPYDAIIVTAAAPVVPGPLQAQLSPLGGRLVIPVGGEDAQYLELVVRHGNHWDMKRVAAVKFVPLVGRYGFPADANTRRY